MSATIEIEYYNTYWLKYATTEFMEYDRTSGSIPNGTYRAFLPVWPGVEDRGVNIKSAIPSIAHNYPVYPYATVTSYPTSKAPLSNINRNANIGYNSSDGANWIIEEARIYGDFNYLPSNLGIHAYVKQEKNSLVQRSSGLIYSGIFNSRTSFNATNVFSVATDITKSVDPHNGSIQLIDAMDNDLTIYQENKVSQALIDKDAIYSAEGAGTPVTSTKLVIGKVTPYVGDYGISLDPESFAKWGYRRYFSDKFRNAVMRLSRDGLTEISKYGMTDWFRDNLSTITETLQSYSSREYQVVYDKSTGNISQSPDPFNPGNNPLEEVGPWLEINTEGGDVTLDTFCNDIEIGSFLEVSIDGGATFQQYSAVVTGFGSDVPVPPDATKLYVYLNEAALPISFTPGQDADVRIRFTYYKQDRIIGGFDTYKDNYVISLQKFSGNKEEDLKSTYASADETINEEGYYSTLAFDEGPKGWTTFYTFRPDFLFSVKNRFMTLFSNNSYTNEKLGFSNVSGLYEHYVGVGYNNFYNNREVSSITFIFNGNPSINKNFKTINYEGNDGWQVDYMRSDIIDSNFDQTNVILSYSEGEYTENNIQYYAGFNKKANKFHANLVNNSRATSGEVIFGDSISGIKGFFATVKMSTDLSTNLDTAKELFSVGTEFSISNR